LPVQDAEVQEALKIAGWVVFVVWECEVRKPETLEALAAKVKSVVPGEGFRLRLADNQVMYWRPICVMNWA
jgi:G:T-mismatch repair DNA endonuclease (very short patch repair protein)